eukprot:c40987_g1_i1 orf=38-205(+)
MGFRSASFPYKPLKKKHPATSHKIELRFPKASKRLYQMLCPPVKSFQFKHFLFHN